MKKALSKIGYIEFPNLLSYMLRKKMEKNHVRWLIKVMSDWWGYGYCFS